MKFSRYTLVLTVLLVSFGCGGPEDGDSVVYNKIQTLGEGYTLSIQLPKGTYKLELTSSNYGVGVTWIGGACTNRGETPLYKDVCTLTMPGQLKIDNPTTWGLGPSEIVTIKVTRL